MTGNGDPRNADLGRDRFAKDRYSGTFENERGSAQRQLGQKLARRAIGVLQRVIVPRSGGALFRSLVGRVMAVTVPCVVMVVAVLVVVMMSVTVAGRGLAVPGFSFATGMGRKRTPRVAAATVTVLVEQARERDDQHVAGQHGRGDPATGGSRKGHRLLLESEAHMQFIC